MTWHSRLKRLLPQMQALDERWSVGLGLLAIRPASLGLRLLRPVAVVGAHLGDGILWGALGALAYALASPPVRGKITGVVLVVLFEALIVSALKLTLRRQRPLNAAGRGFFRGYDRYAFPSGHAARMFCLAVLSGALDPGWGRLMWPVAVWVAASRVLLGVHHLGDVLVGGGIGAAVAWLALRLTTLF